MPQIHTNGPEGPETVHLLEAEESAAQLDSRMGHPSPDRNRWPWPIKYGLWLVGCIAVSFALGSGYFTPEKAWPDWLAAVVVIGGAVLFIAFVSGRRRS